MVRRNTSGGEIRKRGRQRARGNDARGQRMKKETVKIEELTEKQKWKRRGKGEDDKAHKTQLRTDEG